MGGSGSTRRNPACPSGCPPYPFVNIQPLLIVGIKLGLPWLEDIQNELDFIEMVIISKCMLSEIKDKGL